MDINTPDYILNLYNTNNQNGMKYKTIFKKIFKQYLNAKPRIINIINSKTLLLLSEFVTIIDNYNIYELIGNKAILQIFDKCS